MHLRWFGTIRRRVDRQNDGVQTRLVQGTVATGSDAQSSHLFFPLLSSFSQIFPNTKALKNSVSDQRVLIKAQLYSTIAISSTQKSSSDRFESNCATRINERNISKIGKGLSLVDGGFDSLYVFQIQDGNLRPNTHTHTNKRKIHYSA